MKKLGFGCMRLPMRGEDVDIAAFTEMVDLFMEAGFNYFDTARIYIKGKSETAIRECISKRYPRESFVLTNKLSTPCFKCEDDIRPLFEDQLKACGVEYFDYYLMHAQSGELYEKYTACRAYEIASELKAEGKIKHIGISFHDSAAMLDKILTEQPAVEIVQLQLNYLDWDDSAVQSRMCYEVARKHGKPVLVMEPVKGGSLVNLPDEGKAILESLGGGSLASYAIRFAAGHDGIFTVLSGMSTKEQVLDNISYMKDFKPLDGRESAAVRDVVDVFKRMDLIPCTACRYCTDGCPMSIKIPDLFACLNTRKREGGWSGKYYYGIHTKDSAKASECIGCRKCEEICPQHLEIRRLLSDVAAEFEAK